jgi:hypothetical protein
MNSFAQLTSASTLQKYAFYWRSLFTDPNALIGNGSDSLKASDAIVFSTLNLTLAVVLQDRLLFLINNLSTDAVVTKVVTYLLLSLVFSLLAVFCFSQGLWAAWAAGLIAGAVSCVVATVALSIAFVFVLAASQLGVLPFEISVGPGVEWLDRRGAPLALGGVPLSNVMFYHGALLIALVFVGIPTLWRLADRRILSVVLFVPLFGAFTLMSATSSLGLGPRDIARILLELPGASAFVQDAAPTGRETGFVRPPDNAVELARRIAGNWSSREECWGRGDLNVRYQGGQLYYENAPPQIVDSVEADGALKTHAGGVQSHWRLLGRNVLELRSGDSQAVRFNRCFIRTAPMMAPPP